MRLDANELYYEMLEIFAEHKSEDNLLVICNEGGSRSSKTFDAFAFIVTYCDHNRNSNKQIYVLRDTLTNCRDFTYKDWQNFLTLYQIPHETKSSGQKPDTMLFGNMVSFRGLDDEANTEGYPSDGIFLNEALETKESKVAGLKMRCRSWFIADWNPKFTQHWIFNWEGRPNHHFTHSTYKNNKHLEKSVIATIESYSPWMLEDLHLPEQERRPHLTNINAGTADKWRWMVYGMGIRSAPEGRIFHNVDFVDAFPPDVDKIIGIDYGFTSDPTAIVYAGMIGKDLYLELLMYEPADTSETIHNYALARGIEFKRIGVADSSDKYTGENRGTVEMTRELAEKGWSLRKVRKTQSIMFWLGKMKELKIHIIHNDLAHYARKELENYTLRKVNGIAINQPIDDFNHFWDAARYAYMTLDPANAVRSLSI